MQSKSHLIYELHTSICVSNCILINMLMYFDLDLYSSLLCVMYIKVEVVDYLNLITISIDEIILL